MNNDIILKAENLYFSYDDENSHSLNGLSLEIKRGQKVAFMGSNGSGKSTFFLCCNGIHRPSSGTLYFDGEPVTYDKKGLLKLRSKVGIVFQDPDNQLFSASVYQEISFGILNLGVSEEDAKKEVEEVIDHLEITPFRHKPTHSLSGGQKKQVSIADILVMHPDIIILDEPAAGMNPNETAELMDTIRFVRDNFDMTILLIEHDMKLVSGICEELTVLNFGQVLCQGPTSTVLHNPEVVKAYLGE